MFVLGVTFCHSRMSLDQRAALMDRHQIEPVFRRTGGSDRDLTALPTCKYARSGKSRAEPFCRRRCLFSHDVALASAGPASWSSAAAASASAGSDPRAADSHSSQSAMTGGTSDPAMSVSTSDAAATAVTPIAARSGPAPPQRDGRWRRRTPPPAGSDSAD